MSIAPYHGWHRRWYSPSTLEIPKCTTPCSQNFTIASSFPFRILSSFFEHLKNQKEIWNSTGHILSTNILHHRTLQFYPRFNFSNNLIFRLRLEKLGFHCIQTARSKSEKRKRERDIKREKKEIKGFGKYRGTRRRLTFLAVSYTFSKHILFICGIIIFKSTALCEEVLHYDENTAKSKQILYRFQKYFFKGGKKLLRTFFL